LTLNVPFVDLHAQYAAIRSPVQDAIREVLESGSFILGPNVEQFESAFADYCGGGEAIGVGSGTDALHLALRACSVGPGDEVITVSNSFVATALAIDHVGATPVFVEVDPVSYTMDVSKVEALVTPRTRAILPVHLYGQAADLDPILEIARRNNLFVIEDACQAHGAEYRGARVGALGDIGCFSFYPAKNLGAYGDGGLVLTRRADLAERVRLLRNYGQIRKYQHILKGYNSRLDELHAAVLLAKLAHLDAWNAARRRVAESYRAGIQAESVTLPSEHANARHVYHLYVIRTANRDALQEWLTARGITSQIHYPVPIHKQEAYRALDVSRAQLALTEELAGEVLSLPMYPELTDAQVDWVIESVNAFPGPDESPGRDARNG
jgi:dTDP-4-amino-4,6-dideoxygalactose transaminase